MVSSSGDHDHTDLQAVSSANSLVPGKPRTDWASHLDVEQVFRLIDSILPFEACLYHQILPLGLEGSRLRLGMVNLEDTSALDYVRRILAYMNCSLVPQTIASDIHHAALSAYLNYTGNQKKPVYPRNSAPSHSVAHFTEQQLEQNATNSDISVTSQNRKDEDSTIRDPNSHPTLLVDSPEDLNFQDLDVSDPQAPPPAVLSNKENPQQLELYSGHPNGQQTTFILKSDPPPAEAPPEIPSPADSLPSLEIHAKHLSDPVEVLAKLPPSELLQEILGRVLLSGIGRLYLERQPNNARILWSQNGVLQSVLENLSLETFQGVINELKLLTRLPLIPVQKPKQVEIERLYQRHRLLLRFRVMPGNYGEEATVQVLRGAALKFYQQQQLANLSRDALNIAQELQQKVNEIRVRTRFYPMLTADQLSILPALDKVLKSVEQQLDALKALQLAEARKEEEE